MVGQRIAHYEILEKLGEGGMGVVYKARDHKLGRLVALKLLASPTESSSEAVQRFEREARAVSALNHPHIAAIHDRGETDGKPYLVLEYLPGGSLRDKIKLAKATGERLPIREVVRYALEVADGLSHAHRKGVVHRDVKPENMMLTEDDRIKVADFGLAVWGEAARITGSGRTVGTAAYLSPEQAQQLPIDHRSDLFSFGVMLHELATGEIPFRGEYPAAVIYDVVNSPIPDLTAKLSGEGYAPLEQIVRRATAKNPDERYQSMGEAATDLEDLRSTLITAGRTSEGRAAPRERPAPPQSRGWKHKAWISAAAAVIALGVFLIPWGSREEAAPPVAPPAPAVPATTISIAVLPFENLSQNPDQSYLADGVTEALITSLAKAPALRVISRNSAMRYRNAGKSAREIAAELKVSRLVQGSVLRVGNQIRVTAQLIDAGTDEHLWAESYQRDLEDVLSLQQDVAEAIAGQVQINLATRQPLPRAGDTGPVNPAAYAAWIRGRIEAYQWTPEGITNGVASFRRAIELDPDYAAGHAGLALVYGFQALLGFEAPSEAWDRARPAATRAIELDATSADGYTVLAFVESAYDWDWADSYQLYQQALAINPGSPDANLGLAMTCLAPQGRLDEALEYTQKALELDPLAPAVSVSLAHLHFFRREYEEAVRQYERTLALHPMFPEALASLGLVHLKRGDARSAAAMFSASSESWSVLSVVSNLANGRRDAAARAVDQLEAARKNRYVSGYDLAVVNLMVGRQERAIEWLETAFEDRATGMMFLKISPMLDPVRSDPRFQDLLRRMGLT